MALGHSSSLYTNAASQINLYPRTSIDNSRRVRQLAHALQGTLTALSGKRIAPYISKVVGSWLSGAYDSDKSVARAAQESISLSFTSDEKRKALWRVYKTALIEYAEDAILEQTPKTLSDERSTTPDDAEAKFVRVVGNAIYMLCQVIRTNFSAAGADQRQSDEGLTKLLQNTKLWEYSYSNDPVLRRATCSLVVVCTQIMPSCLTWTAISACFIAKALHSKQLGSATQLSEALLALTTARPEVWTTDYSSKTTASKRLLQFIRNGSQRGLPSFWTNVALLLRKLPAGFWNKEAMGNSIDLQIATNLVDALHNGISSAEEPRQNLETAWSVYVELSFWIMDMLLDSVSKSTLLDKHLLPLVSHYIASDPQSALRSLPASAGAKIAGTILVGTLHRGLHSSFAAIWHQLCQQLVESMKLSLPESSKDFAKSQDDVVAQSQRLLRLKPFVLQSSILSPSEQTQAVDVFQKSDENLMLSAMELLQARNGKPYGAARVLESIAVESRASHIQPLEKFLTTGGLDLLTSPSAEYLIAIVLHTHLALEQSVTRLINSEESAFRLGALSRLLREIHEDDWSKSEELQTYVLHKISADLGSESTQTMVRAILENGHTEASDLRKACAQCILNRLSTETNSDSRRGALHFLISLISTASTAPFLVSEDLGGELLSKLLFLSDSEDPETAELANSLRSKLSKVPAGTSTTAISSTMVINDQLSGNGVPLSIFGLINLAKDTLQHLPSATSEATSPLMPSAAQWNRALESHILGRRPLSLSITSSLHGLLLMIESDNTPIPVSEIADADEFSLLFRLVFYVTKMLSDSDILAHQSADQLRTLYQYYPLALQLVNEKLTMESANDIWQNTSNEVTEEASDILSQGNILIQRWIDDEAMIRIWIDVIRSTTNLTLRSYLQGLTFVDIASRFIDEHGSSLIMSSFESELKVIHRAPEVVRSASLICACRDQLVSSPQGRRLLNELIAACTDLKGLTPELRPLVQLNLLLNGGSEPLDGVPSQRLVFLMQAILRLLDGLQGDLAFQIEALKLLDPVLSAARDMYGPHWEQVLELLVATWRREGGLEDDLPLLHASLRLYARLKSLAGAEEANEDLVESWTAAQHSLEEGLLSCLENFGASSTYLNQPRRITSELLRRQLSHISVRHDPNLYSLLSSPDTAIRQAAYSLLHRSIPAEQEQISLEYALEQKSVHLSSELLLSLSATSSTTIGDDELLRPSYLLSWHLIFDHFVNASYKLQEVYTADIKEKEILQALLNLICEVCRITSGRPLDASKFEVKTFEFVSGETDEHQEQRLSMHLYHCCLLYVPSLTRGWFIEQKNRVKSPLESWTQKHFSPSLTLAATETVTEWVASQPEDNEAPVIVKTSLGGSEVVASIAVDPESPPISLAISLPSTYPLDSPTISSRKRVGVSENHWQSWLRTIQIIIFSSGSIIEGLVAFRRNVQGALKGQSECAICYSIIGTDMQTPNKRCGTCRNTFHGICLFRWFKSSNSSSCPLCRNNFNYA